MLRLVMQNIKDNMSSIKGGAELSIWNHWVCSTLVKGGARWSKRWSRPASSVCRGYASLLRYTPLRGYLGGATLQRGKKNNLGYDR